MAGRGVWRLSVQREEARDRAIAGQVGAQGSGTVSYTLESEGTGTRFTRVFRYKVNRPLFAVVNLLFYQRRVTAESVEALRRLKRWLEAGAS